MKKIYKDDAERQRAYRLRKVSRGFKKLTLYVPAEIAKEIEGEPQKLVEAYIKTKARKRREKQK